MIKDSTTTSAARTTHVIRGDGPGLTKWHCEVLSKQEGKYQKAKQFKLMKV